MSTYPGGFDPSVFPESFGSAYRTHLQNLMLKGLQPKTIDAYARTIRRMGDYFDHQIDDIAQDLHPQLVVSRVQRSSKSAPHC